MLFLFIYFIFGAVGGLFAFCPLFACRIFIFIFLLGWAHFHCQLYRIIYFVVIFVVVMGNGEFPLLQFLLLFCTMDIVLCMCVRRKIDRFFYMAFKKHFSSVFDYEKVALVNVIECHKWITFQI